MLYESSSLPILASKTPPNIETSQHLMLDLFDPTDSKELSILIDKVFNGREEKEREQIISNNKESITQFSWSNIASYYQEFFEKKYSVELDEN